MKNFFLLGIIVTLSFPAISKAQTLFTVAKEPVSSEEFLRAFNKNNTNETSKMGMEEYLNLYTNFKLKVKAARDAGMDTIPRMKQDVDLFRSQVIQNYLADDDGVNNMQQEAFIRSQTDLRVTHFSSEINGADSISGIAAFKSFHQALRGGKNLKSLSQAAQVSIKDLGFITVFSLPYFYENLVYNTAVGNYSDLVQKNGKMHFFKVESSRPAAGIWKASQILLAFPSESTGPEKQMIKNRADSLYEALKKGYDFEKAAERFSNDRITNLTGGLLPSFGTGRYSADFELPVFALKNDGDITKPFETSFGYHIVKRLSADPVISDPGNVNYKYELKQKIMSDARMKIAREAYESSIVQLTGWAITNKVLQNKMLTYSDLKTLPATAVSDKTVIGKYSKGNKISVADWARFVDEYWKTHEDDGTIKADDLWLDFEKKMALKEYTDHLELYNKEFFYQLKEFNEGNLLFEIMEQKVWGRSSEDNVALMNYYNANKAKYLWEVSVDAVVVNCDTRELAVQTMQQMKSGKSIAAIMTEGNGRIFSDSARYVLDQLIDKKNAPDPAPGVYSSIVTNSENGGSFVIFHKIYPAGEQRSFSDARGLVINDYQEVLEKEWIESLNKTYAVALNTAEWQKISKSK